MKLVKRKLPTLEEFTEHVISVFYRTNSPKQYSRMTEEEQTLLKSQIEALYFARNNGQSVVLKSSDNCITLMLDNIRHPEINGVSATLPPLAVDIKKGYYLKYNFFDFINFDFERYIRIDTCNATHPHISHDPCLGGFEGLFNANIIRLSPLMLYYSLKSFSTMYNSESPFWKLYGSRMELDISTSDDVILALENNPILNWTNIKKYDLFKNSNEYAKYFYTISTQNIRFFKELINGENNNAYLFYLIMLKKGYSHESFFNKIYDFCEKIYRVRISLDTTKVNDLQSKIRKIKEILSNNNESYLTKSISSRDLKLLSQFHLILTYQPNSRYTFKEFRRMFAVILYSILLEYMLDDNIEEIISDIENSVINIVKRVEKNYETYKEIISEIKRLSYDEFKETLTNIGETE